MSVSSFAVEQKYELEIQEDLQNLYDADRGEQVKGIIKEYVRQRDDLSEACRYELLESLKVVSKLDGTKCAVITHIRFFDFFKIISIVISYMYLVRCGYELLVFQYESVVMKR